MSLAAFASKTNKYTNTKELRTCFSEIKHPGPGSSKDGQV